jgi:hypothetical protein
MERKMLAELFIQLRKQSMAKKSTAKALWLSKKNDDERLEAACAHALHKLTSPRYRHIKAILDSNLEKPPSLGSAVRRRL